MKKYVTGLAAVILAISASAFTKATAVTEGQYYLNNGQIVPIETDGYCGEGIAFCRYHLKENAEDNKDPQNYEGEGVEGQQWVPLP